jgi:hypothetical protein
MASAVAGQFNYINPSIAPQSPEEPLKDPLHTGSDTDLYLCKEKVVKNGRAHAFNLKHDGFELLTNVPPMSLDRNQFTNKRARYHAARDVFGPLANRLVQESLGLYSCFAWYVVPPYYRTSSSLPNQAKEDKKGSINHSLGTQPHCFVHNDYGFQYKQYLQNLEPKDILKDTAISNKVSKNYRSAGRVIVMQFWFNAQPEGTVIEQDPLAICHPRSVKVNDLVTRPLSKYNGRDVPDKAVILQAKDSKHHEWLYWPKMKSGEECLCWIGYDSAWPAPQPCFHSSFRDPTAPRNARPRESMECRVVLLLDQIRSSKL